MTIDQVAGSEHDVLEAQYSEYLGGLSPAFERELDRSRAYFERFMAMVQVPARRGALTDLEQNLIGVAVVANVTHHHTPRLDAYLRRARACGASEAQIHDALQLASVLGVHALTVGIPTIVEAFEEAGVDLGDRTALDERRQQLKDDFVAARGYWHESWDDMLVLDPDMFEAYTAYSRLPAERGVLEPKLRELIYIAIDSVATHLYVPGIKLHAVNAIRLGATSDEIITAIEIASLIGANPYFDVIDRL
ncbi:MAG: carboxymuconolactone decarboxylase family protein [Comamonadaceae bacterium]|nr:MAG: carboxymuconolactone decarboxylase family protein [Comamonadaceae bacterium]